MQAGLYYNAEGSQREPRRGVGSLGAGLDRQCDFTVLYEIAQWQEECYICWKRPELKGS